MSTKNNLDVQAVKQQAAGRWPELLSGLGGVPLDVLDGKNHPCPKCGGVDRFRLIDAEAGALYCNQCFSKNNGDGIAAIQHFVGIDFKAAVHKLADYLGVNGAPTRNGSARIVATYNYVDEQAELLYQAIRLDPKGFYQRRPKPGGGWDNHTVDRHSKEPLVRFVPYRLPEILASANGEVIYICEGEKDCDNLARLGIVATTNVGGAGKWKPEYNQHLRGRRVVMLPDNDDPGRKHAQQVASSLHGVAAAVKIVELPDLPDKGDVSDWLVAGGTREKLLALVEAAPEWKPAAASQSKRSTAPEPFQPFPLAALPEPLRGFVAAGAKAIGCDSSYIALPLLTVIAASIGNTRRLLLKHGWAVPPVLWTAIVGESGTSKSPAFKLAMKPIRKREAKALKRRADALREYETDLAHYEKALAEWKRDKKATDDPPKKPEEPQAERCIVSDTTVEALAPLLFANPRGLLLARDELAGWIGSFDRYAGKGKGGADAAHFLSMHAGDNIIVDRKTGVPRTIFVPQACLSICGGIQPGILNRALGTEYRESGLAARLLLTCPPRKAKTYSEAEIDPAAEREIARLIDRLFDLKPSTDDDGELCPLLVTLTRDAKAAWKAYFIQHAQEQVELTGDLSAAWSKLEEYAARLALVIHFARWAADDATLESDSKLDAASMTAGIVLANCFKHETKRVYALLDETDEGRGRRRLAEWIANRGGSALAREVQQGCRWLKESGAAEAALEELVKAGWGEWEAIPVGQSGGRPTRRFILSTVSTVYGTPITPAENDGFVDVDSVDGSEAQADSDEWGEV